MAGGAGDGRAHGSRHDDELELVDREFEPAFEEELPAEPAPIANAELAALAGATRRARGELEEETAPPEHEFAADAAPPAPPAPPGDDERATADDPEPGGVAAPIGAAAEEGEDDGHLELGAPGAFAIAEVPPPVRRELAPGPTAHWLIREDR